MTSEIKKAIIPIAGNGTRFLPLSKVVPKELFPLGEKPLIHRLLEELKASGIEEIVFVVGKNNKKLIADYFKRSLRMEKFLEERGKKDLIEVLRAIDKLTQGISFSFVLQTNPLGDGHAVLQAAKLIGNNPCVVAYPDDIIESEIPCTTQLAQVFKTSQKPVMGLWRMPKEKISHYGVVQADKIARRLHQIKKIVEKPSQEAAPSDLAIIGRRIITPETFDYLKKAKPNKKGEIILTEVFADMVKAGKMIYGYEVEGQWLECGNYEGWMRSNAYLALKHPTYGKDIKNFLKQEKVI